MRLQVAPRARLQILPVHHVEVVLGHLTLQVDYLEVEAFPPALVVYILRLQDADVQACGCKFCTFTKPCLSNMWSEMEVAHNLGGQLIIMLYHGVVSVYLAKERVEKDYMHNYTTYLLTTLLTGMVFASCARGSKFCPFTKPGLSNMWSEMEEGHDLRGQLIIMLYLRLLSA